MKKLTSFAGTIVAACAAVAIMAAALTSGAAPTEKGAERLVTLTKASRSPSSPVAMTAAVSAAHRCPACSDSWVKVADKATKGPNHLVKNEARHDCSACSTEIITRGSGKAARAIAVHSCVTPEKAVVCCVAN